METVTISLNGRELSGQPGTTILELSKQAGVDIPTLCHHPLLKSAGACRVCLVEEVKTGRLLASCVTPIAKGMEILTHSTNAISARRSALELILSDHPSACIICNKGNECTLRLLAKDHGICDPDLPPLRRWRPIDESNPFIARDLTKCILCGRCIRVCKDFEAVGAVEYLNRGHASHPGTVYGTPLERSECNFCGSCVALCPTGALDEKNKPRITSGKDYVPGICSYCGTGCHLEYELVDKVVIGGRGVPDSPLNSLSLCVRGHYGQDALGSPDRLHDPFIRDSNGSLRKTTWKEALDSAAAGLRKIVQTHGPDSIGVIVGPRCSNEELYLAGRFARSVLGTPHLNSPVTYSSGTVVAALADSLHQIRTKEPPLDRLADADTILLIGARPDYTHPVIARNIRRAFRHKGAAVIQFDPLVTTLSPFAQIHFKCQIEELPSVFIRLMKELVVQKGHDEDFVIANAVNPKEFLFSLKHQLGDPPCEPVLKEIAKLIGKDRDTFFLLGPMCARATHGYILTRLIVDLALLCAKPDNMIFLFEGCNEMGIWELGCASSRLRICPQERRSDVSANRYSDTFHRPGLHALEMLRAAEKGYLKALILLNVDPLATFPDTERTKNALNSLELLIRAGIFPATVEEIAHIVLPTTSIAEADGSYVNIEGRVQRVSKIMDPPGNARPLARILLELAGMLESPLGFVMARDIFTEISKEYHAWKGLTWAGALKPGGEFLSTPRISDQPNEMRESATRLAPYIPPDSFSGLPRRQNDRPWKVLPEEQIAHPGDGIMSKRSWHLAKFESFSWVRMNPKDAEKIRATNGTSVVVRSEIGQVEARLSIDPDVPPSSVVIPAGGPTYILQRLLPWPEEHCPPGWDRIFVSVEVAEE